MFLKSGHKKKSDYFIISQDAEKKSQGNELYTDGKIYLLTVVNHDHFRIKKLKILDRDEYPLNPYRLYYYEDRNASRLYILNRPVSYKFVIEVFDFRNDFLKYSYRIHLDENISATDIYVKNPEEICVSAKFKIGFSASKLFYETINPVTIFRGLLLYKNKVWDTINGKDEIYQIETAGNDLYLLKDKSVEKYDLKSSEKNFYKKNLFISLKKDKPVVIAANQNSSVLVLKEKKHLKIMDVNRETGNLMEIYRYKNNKIKLFSKLENSFFIKTHSENNLKLCRN